MSKPRIAFLGLGLVGSSIHGMATNVGHPKPERDRFNNLFNGEWSASYFMSQDPVAIDSVCLDFLRCEFPVALGLNGARAFPLGAIHKCDNYLHEAARTRTLNSVPIGLMTSESEVWGGMRDGMIRRTNNTAATWTPNRAG